MEPHGTGSLAAALLAGVQRRGGDGRLSHTYLQVVVLLSWHEGALRLCPRLPGSASSAARAR